MLLVFILLENLFSTDIKDHGAFNQLIVWSDKYEIHYNMEDIASKVRTVVNRFKEECELIRKTNGFFCLKFFDDIEYFDRSHVIVLYDTLLNLLCRRFNIPNNEEEHTSENMSHKEFKKSLIRLLTKKWNLFNSKVELYLLNDLEGMMVDIK